MPSKSTLSRAVLIGFLLMLAWAVSSAYGQVFTADIEQAADPIFVCLATTSIAVVIFLSTGKFQLRNMARKVKQQPKLVLLLNITTVCVWLFNFYPLKYIEPAIVVAIILGVRPLTGLFASHLVYKKDNISKTDFILSFMAFLFVLYLAYVSLADKSGLVTDIPIWKQIFCIGICLVSGGVLSLNMIYTKQLSDHGFTPYEILSTRFWLLILITACLSAGMHTTHTITGSFWIDMLVIACILIVLPQYCLQFAVQRLKPVSTAVIVPLMPVLVFCLEFWDHRLHPNVWTIAGIGGIFIVVLIYAIFRYYFEKRNIRAEI